MPERVTGPMIGGYRRRKGPACQLSKSRSIRARAASARERPAAGIPCFSRLMASSTLPDETAVKGDLLDLVPDRREALEILRDGPQIGRGHVLVAGQRALDVLAHEPAGHVAIAPIARSEVRDDLLLGPVADPRRLVG